MRIVWRVKAKLELNGHVAYIKKRSPQNAQHVLDTLLELGNSLGNMPYKYPKEPPLQFGKRPVCEQMAF